MTSSQYIYYIIADTLDISSSVITETPSVLDIFANIAGVSAKTADIKQPNINNKENIGIFIAVSKHISYIMWYIMEINSLNSLYALYSVNSVEKSSTKIVSQNENQSSDMDKINISEEAVKLAQISNNSDAKEIKSTNEILKSDKASDYTEGEMLALLNGRINGDLPHKDGVLPENKALLHQLESMQIDIENKYPNLDDLYANGYNEIAAMRAFAAHAGEYVKVTIEDAVRFMQTEQKSQEMCYTDITANMNYEEGLNYIKSVDSLTDIILLNARMWADDSLSEEYKNNMYQQLLDRFMEIDKTPENIAQFHLDPEESSRYYKNHNKPLDIGSAKQIADSIS